ncbi:MAG: cupredoxin domain-containing protein [Ktedonobacterales bacterium]|nr:cupredoxin domain-containing protein [Ktedonobacterales bacterium]
MRLFAGQGRIRTPFWLFSLLIAIALGIAGCGGASGTGSTTTPTPTATPTTPPTEVPTTAPSSTVTVPPNTVLVRIINFKFLPSAVTIKKGMKVLWLNTADTDHTATSLSGDPASFDGPVGASGGTFTFTFTVAGTYNYHCAIHPSMLATITVTS